MALTILTGSSQAAAFNYSYTTSGSADWASVPTASYFYDIIDKTVRFKATNSTYSNVATASFALTASSFTGTVTSASYASTATYATQAGYATSSLYASTTGLADDATNAANVNGYNYATPDQINIGDLSTTNYDYIVRAQELEQSKFTTINIFNFLNF
jgi:hypothetical protein